MQILFKENKFNKLLVITFAVIISVIWLILIIGNRSTPKVTSFEIFGQKNSIVPVKTQISLGFNRVMNRDTIEKNLIISPEVKGNFTWSGKKVFFTPKDKLNYNQKYTLYLSQATDLDGNFLNQEFETTFQTKTSAVFFISEDENTQGYLRKTSIDNKEEEIVNKSISTYAISPDGNRVLYTLDTSENNSQIFVKDLEQNSEKEISLKTTLFTNGDSIKIYRVLYGKNEIAILAQGYSTIQKTFISGKQILLYDLSTTEVTKFTPKDGIEDTDTMYYTPDYAYLLYRNSNQTYAYSSIANKNSDPILLGKFISINGFNYQQNKLSITDFDAIKQDFQFVAFIDDKRNIIKVSDLWNNAQDPKFANTADVMTFAEQLGIINDFGLSGIVKKNLDQTNTTTLYFDKSYSSELPQFSPDDKYIAFERYTTDQVAKSLTENRIIFNSVKPKYGQIVIINPDTKVVKVLAEKGRDITWDN